MLNFLTQNRFTLVSNVSFSDFKKKQYQNFSSSFFLLLFIS